MESDEPCSVKTHLEADCLSERSPFSGACDLPQSRAANRLGCGGPICYYPLAPASMAIITGFAWVCLPCHDDDLVVLDGFDESIGFVGWQ